MEPVAIDQAAAFLGEDPGGLRAVLHAVDRLAVDPFMEESTALGTPLLRRLWVGRYRIWFAVEEDVVRVLRIACSPH